MKKDGGEEKKRKWRGGKWQTGDRMRGDWKKRKANGKEEKGGDKKRQRREEN